MTLSIDTGRPADAAHLATIPSDGIDQTDRMPRLHRRDTDRAHVGGLPGIRMVRTKENPDG